MDFSENFNLLNRVLIEIETFDQNFRFLTKISISDQDFDF